MALEAPPNQFDPLTFQTAPLLLLNVAAMIMLDGEVPSATLPDMVPELLTVTPPLLPALGPLFTPSATFRPLLENSFAVTVPVIVLVKVAPCALLLLSWTTELLPEPSAVIEPALVIEMIPCPVAASPLPVPATIPVPLGADKAPLLVIVTLPPPCANAFTPAEMAEMVEDASIIALRLPTPK